MKKIKSLCLGILFTFLFFISQCVFSQDKSEEFINSIRQGKIEEVKNFIDTGMDVNLIWTERHTPIMIAIWGGHTNIVKLLVDKGADVNIHTEKGGNAINVAAQAGNIEICDFLLNKGAGRPP